MKIEKRHLLNYSILIPYLLLSIIGLIIVYSATSANLVYAGLNPFRTVINQFAFWLISLLGIWFIYRLKLDFLRSKRVLFMALLVELVLLIVARFFTPTINGAHGWISIPRLLTFQPAEYLKLIIVWWLAYAFARRQTAISKGDYLALIFAPLPLRGFKRSPKTKQEFQHNLFCIGELMRDWRITLPLMILLIGSMPDLGNATIIILTGIFLYSVSGIAYRWFTILLAGIVSLSSLFLGAIAVIGVETVSKTPVFGYVAKRFSAFFNPFADLTGAGHQLAHSYYAMSNGGWFGRGLGNSIEKNGYLPEAHTDFIFAIVIEELGLIGAGLILALVFFLILRIFLVGIKAKNAFNSMLALGIGVMLLVQVFVNVGGISGLIPSTGVTFPFLSQGGNSLLVLSIAIAVVLNIDANEKRSAILRQLREQEELEN